MLRYSIAAVALALAAGLPAPAHADTVELTLNQTFRDGLWTLSALSNQRGQGFAVGAEAGQRHAIGIGRYYLRSRRATRFVPIAEVVGGYAAPPGEERGRFVIGIGGGMVLPLLTADRWSLDAGYTVRLYRDGPRFHAGMSVGF